MHPTECGKDSKGFESIRPAPTNVTKLNTFVKHKNV